MRKGKQALADTVNSRKKDGGTISCEWASAQSEDGSGTLLGYTSFVTDISKRLEHEQQITHQAFYDAITDVLNRLIFMNA